MSVGPYNYLPVNTFELKIDRAPNVSFYAQTINFPTVGFPETDTPFPGYVAKFPGDTIQYGELGVEFIVDEYLKTYKEIYAWFREMVPRLCPKNTPASPVGTGSSVKEIYSNLYLLPMTASSSDVTTTFQFIDAFPTSISPLTFQTNNGTIQYMTCTVTFAFTYFEIL